MPNNLEPTPERIAAAKRAQSKEWSFGPEGFGEIMTNETLGEMVVAGLIEPRFVTAEQQMAGRSDYLWLTPNGEAWLARAGQQGAATRPSPSASDQDWEEPRPAGHVCSAACTHTRPARRRTHTAPRPPGDHVNCEHDPNSTATDLLGAMICAPVPPVVGRG